MAELNNKYIVFKREEWDDHVNINVGGPEPAEVEDAVVIRRQDIFAGPALHAYAACIGLTVNLFGDADLAHRMERIADYFHEQAVLADEVAASGDAKFPD